MCLSGFLCGIAIPETETPNERACTFESANRYLTPGVEYWTVDMSRGGCGKSIETLISRAGEPHGLRNPSGRWESIMRPRTLSHLMLYLMAGEVHGDGVTKKRDRWSVFRSSDCGNSVQWLLSREYPLVTRTRTISIGDVIEVPKTAAK